ncbi:di-heme oxidoredictase family protein [Pseudoroseicyclus tamaricis]|uniref:C-type cytochrome n=1 Tax=Pseudoroseicyclus tamaricis TaxID=2705421 RepID=A0A6B2K028_9RHOB|nr:di-heme oxidoredictase family protein [Pseudoroseicyclus tamaricis]NDV01022.1 c-type cytochrome [Pseudoroseicyclus tamaricis]
MRRTALITSLAALAVAGAVFADGGPEAHPQGGDEAPASLPDLQAALLPRTEEEAARIAAVTAPATSFDAPETFELLPGGAATVRASPTTDAFSEPSDNLDGEGRMNFALGNGLFRKVWVSSPSSTQASDGLGPLYNARACQLCHVKDARGHPAAAGQDQVALFLRLSVPDPDAAIEEIAGWIGTAPEPTYGGQLQNFALPGIPAEGRLSVSYEETVVPLAGGESATLLAPTYALADLAYGDPAADVMLSPRVAPQMIGLGLLEAIPAADILAHADPEDADGDGISGRPSIAWSLAHDRPMLGRFGHKAGEPSVMEQSARAFLGDVGLSTPLLPQPAGECTRAQEACLTAPHGADAPAGESDAEALASPLAEEGPRGVEVSAEALDLVAHYSRNLAVPARRDVDAPEVLRGKEVFYTAGCPACHMPKFVTGRTEPETAQSFQLIWPYTDLLLHDMGPGLADNRPEGVATGSEWRTAPLWGIGLTELVTGRQSYLHDGRARTLLEAVLWHGGEAQAARDRVVDLAPEDRAALISFLESL